MIKRLLIANRGEIAVRIARSCPELGVETVAVYSRDDENSMHVQTAAEAVLLPGDGPRAYLDIEGIVRAALENNCDAVHPGYGFLSESAELARQCQRAGLTFVGPTPETLEMFGDKAQSRKLAESCGVPILRGTNRPTTLAEARDFLDAQGKNGAVMLKAIAGGGGRGIRRVDRSSDIAQAYETCRSESQRAFGNGDLYVEQFIPRARHIEVQIVGDGSGAVSHLWDRECSLQRQNQKIVEIAPATNIAPGIRKRMLGAAITMAGSTNYRGVGTFEFLLDASRPEADDFVFLEANPRIQVEHTVTEEITGIDLIAVQINIAGGRSLRALELEQSNILQPSGLAVQARINMETMHEDGTARPAGGVLTLYEPPSGPGVRVDGFGKTGYATNARFDSLLAKTIVHVHSGRLSDAMAKAFRALSEFRIEGVETNLAFLKQVVSTPEVRNGAIYTRFLEDHAAELAKAAHDESTARQSARDADPLAILRHVRGPTPEAGPELPLLEGTVAVRAPLQGAIIGLSAAIGDLVSAGKPLLIMDAMKMEHVVSSEQTGIVRAITVKPGDVVQKAALLAMIEPQDHSGAQDATDAAAAEELRPELAEVHHRQALLLDEGRLAIVARRHATGQRTPRENLSDLCDPNSFVEFGGLAVAARRGRNTTEELISKTPADGFIMGTARVNGQYFPDEHARCAVMSYDPTVMAGTQGMKGHEKLDRILELAEKSRLPVVFFTEGGGGRPGDTDKPGVGYNFIKTFSFLGRLSGLVPLIGVNNGRCFGGNAFILGCCDVVIATKNSTIGIGGPAVIEGAGLGSYTAEEVGPASMHLPGGVIDILVEDEPEAVAAAKKYLSYFQGSLPTWSHADQNLLRSVIPQNRRRVYDMHKLINVLADTGSVTMLRSGFGAGMITALIRIEGRPIGILANNPYHLGGAIDSEAADKAGRFMQLCEAFDLPILSLCDTPGNMVGPEAEKTGLIRHCARMVVIGSNLTVPWITIVVRKGYGLGGLAMAGGSFSNCIMTLGWPTGEFGGMPVEGFVKLGYRDQLAAISDLAERKAKYEQMVAKMYDDGKALSAATFFEFDDVIDPIDTRRRVVEALRSAPAAPRREGKKLRWVDTW